VVGRPLLFGLGRRGRRHAGTRCLPWRDPWPSESARASWRTTSALPRCRRKCSRSQSSSPSERLPRRGRLNGCQPPASTSNRRSRR